MSQIFHEDVPPSNSKRFVLHFFTHLYNDYVTLYTIYYSITVQIITDHFLFYKIENLEFQFCKLKINKYKLHVTFQYFTCNNGIHNQRAKKNLFAVRKIRRRSNSSNKYHHSRNICFNRPLIICITFLGARFAVYQTKVGLITILRNYKVITCEKTMIPYQIDPNTFLLAPKGGIYLKLQRLNP